MTAGSSDYDPFARGPHAVGVRTIEARDAERNRLFPVEIWYPAEAEHAGEDLAPATQDSFAVPFGGPPRRQSAVRDAAGDPGTRPLLLFSHHGGGPRRMATFLCTHLSSHGYVVAAMDHSEVVAPELARREAETDQEKAARLKALIASRVPDVRFLLDLLLTGARFDSEIRLDESRIGIVGHSFGGWTALAAVDVEPRIRAVVALAPGGASRRKPGIIPATLAFASDRDVPTLYLVAENDTSLPLEGMKEIFDRTPGTRRMAILRRADHMHFLDEVKGMHEAVRTMPFGGELSWLPKEMRPIAELCSGDDAHLFVRGLTLAHMDAVLRGRKDAERFLGGDVVGELAKRGVEVLEYGR